MMVDYLVWYSFLGKYPVLPNLASAVHMYAFANPESQKHFRAAQQQVSTQQQAASRS